MPRAFLKTKNKGGTHTYTCTVCKKPILSGQSYYTWKFNRGGRFWQHAEHGHPKRSQLSTSKMVVVWDAVDSFDVSGCESVEDIKSDLEAVATAAREVAAKYAESAESIIGSWPAGNPTSVACRDTARELESWAGRLDNWQPSSEDLDEQKEEAQELINEQPEYQG